MTDSNSSGNSCASYPSKPDKPANYPPTKAEFYVMYENAHLLVPDRACNEELAIAEKLWMNRGYVLYQKPNEEERHIMGMQDDPNSPSPMLSQFINMAVEETNSEIIKMRVDNPGYFDCLIKQSTLLFMARLLQFLPLYPNENLVDYAEKRFTPVLDWLLTHNNHDSDDGQESRDADNSHSVVKPQPDLSNYVIPPIVTGATFTINGVQYTPLLWSSVTLGSILKGDDKMWSVFDPISDLESPDEVDDALSQITGEFIYSTLSKITQTIYRELPSSCNGIDNFMTLLSAAFHRLHQRLTLLQ